MSSFSAVDYGKLYYRNIEREKILALKSALGNFDAEMNITKDMKNDLKWWSENIFTQDRKINRGNPQATIKCDASQEGWGAVLNGKETGSRWKNIEKDNHINYLELLAVFYALKSFKTDLLDIHCVKILSDNQTTIAYLQSMGGIKSEKCNEIARAIWLWCIEHEIWITASHIAGNLNTRADFKSRNFNDQIEWQLDKNIFEKICSIWNKPDIDLFATYLNTQLPMFCSWKADPESEYVDAFSLDWSSYFSYMFPPFSLVGRCIKKVITDKAEVIFVGPLWPTQPWFVQVMRLLIDTPYVILANKKLLTLPYKDKVQHPLAKSLNLMVCRISGVGSKVQEYQEKLPVSSWHLGDVQLRNNIKHISRNGFFTVINGKQISFVRL